MITSLHFDKFYFWPDSLGCFWTDSLSYFLSDSSFSGLSDSFNLFEILGCYYYYLTPTVIIYYSCLFVLEITYCSEFSSLWSYSNSSLSYHLCFSFSVKACHSVAIIFYNFVCVSLGYFFLISGLLKFANLTNGLVFWKLLLSFVCYFFYSDYAAEIPRSLL